MKELSPTILGYMFTNPGKLDAVFAKDYLNDPGFIYRMFGKTQLVIEDTRKEM